MYKNTSVFLLNIFNKIDKRMLEKIEKGEFPGVSVVKTPCAHC